MADQLVRKLQVKYPLDIIGEFKLNISYNKWYIVVNIVTFDLDKIT